MARIITQQLLDSRSGDVTVGRSLPFSDQIFFPNNVRTPDDYFLFVSTAPYARKELRIYTFTSAGLFTVDPDLTPPTNYKVERKDCAGVITSIRDCSRFVPCVYPFTQQEYQVNSSTPSNTGVNLESKLNYSEGYYHNIKTTLSSRIMNGYNRTEKGEYNNTFSFITQFDMKRWAVCPMLIGIYGDTSVTTGSDPAIVCGNAVAVSDYFIDPSTYPTTITGYSGYTLIGFTLGFYLASNMGDNSAGYGRQLMVDCGAELDIRDDFSVLGAGYDQYGGAWNYNMEIVAMTKAMYSFIGRGSLLGLVVSPTSYCNSYGNYQGANFPNPIDNFRMTYPTSPGFVNSTNLRSFGVMGSLDYIEWTTDTYHIGNVNSSSGNRPSTLQGHEIRANIPILKSEYIEEEFLLKVASQLGLPVIGSRARVEEFTSLQNIEQVYFDKNWLLIPKFNPETGFVEDEPPTPADEIPEDDNRLAALISSDVFQEIAIANTSDIDPNHYTDNIELNSPNLDAVGKFNRYFAISESDIDDFVDFLYTSDASTISDIIDGLQLNGENPMNFLIGLRMFPFNIAEHAETSPQTIQFGNGVNTGVVGELITKFDAVIDLGSCEFRRYYGNYLDYEPYTTAKLYIPYCNEIDIPTSVFVGHTINVKLIVDITTGACCGVIFKDGIPCLYANGNIGIEIPITGENATEYVKQGLDAAIKATGAAVQIAQNSAMMGKTGFTDTFSDTKSAQLFGSDSGSMSRTHGKTTSHQFSTGGIIGGVAQGLEAAYEFNYMPTALQTNGTSSPTTNLYKPQFCYFIVTSSIPLAPAGYGDTIGYACMEKRNLSLDDGYVVIHNPNVQPEHATSPETNEINQLLSTGVWV